MSFKEYASKEYLDIKMDKENPAGTGSFSMNCYHDSMKIPIGENACVIGQGTIATRKGEFVLGQYNEPDIIVEGITWEQTGDYTWKRVDNNTMTAYVASLDDVIYDVVSGLYSLKNANTVPTSSLPTDVYILSPGTQATTQIAAKPKLVKVNHEYSSSIRRLWYYEYTPNVTVDDNTGMYLFTLGNGTSSHNRSNAHTLDWNGNAWYQGEVYVGGAGQDDATARLLKTSETATDNDVLDVLSEMSYIDPIASSDGSIYTNNNGEIYIL